MGLFSLKINPSGGICSFQSLGKITWSQKENDHSLARILARLWTRRGRRSDEFHPESEPREPKTAVTGEGTKDSVGTPVSKMCLQPVTFAATGASQIRTGKGAVGGSKAETAGGTLRGCTGETAIGTRVSTKCFRQCAMLRNRTKKPPSC